MTEQQNEYIDIGVLLVDIWHAILRYWYCMILIIAVSAAGFYGYKHASYVPMYRAQASFTVKTTGVGNENEVTTSYNFYYDKNTANQIGTTFPYILSSDVFKSNLKETIGCQIINGSISAQVIENSNLVTVQVISSVPEDALTILQGVLEVYPDIAQHVIGNTRLDIVKEAELEAEPYNALSKLPLLVTGAEIGFGICMFLVILYAMTKKTVRKEEDLKNILNVSCLAQIPEIKEKNKIIAMDAAEDKKGYVENIYALQNRISYLMNQNNMKVLVVTSTGPSEGKSTIAANLALAMTQNGKSVLLIDGDLRKPDLKQKLNIPSKAVSLQEILSKDSERIPVQRLMNNVIENILFLGSNKSVNNSIPLICSEAMKGLIEGSRNKFDIIIIDTPPCGMMADAGYYSEYADAILYVVRQDWTDARKIMNAIEELPDHGNKLIGCILNGVCTGSLSYGGYGYGNYSYKRYTHYKGRTYGSRYRSRREDQE